MASPTKKHKIRRIAKLANAGMWRKNKLKREGTTAPDLLLDKPNANEKAQKAAKASAPKVRKVARVARTGTKVKPKTTKPA